MPPRDPKPSLTIRAPSRFNHVRNLKARQTTHDPRSANFQFDSITLDLRQCLRIGPEAILWSAVFLNLARKRGANSELLPPNDPRTSDALASSGVLEILNASRATLKERRPANDFPTTLPICVMRSFTDVERAADRILDSLDSDPRSIPANLYPTVAETFVELANNGVEHSQSEIGTLGLVNLREGKSKGNFEIAVADGGIGISRTLKSSANADGKRTWNDWSSIEYATGELISGTGDPHRGIGLFGVAEDSRLPGAALRIHSGAGLLHINQSSEIRATRKTLFPGTLTYASIQFPTEIQ